MPSETVPEGPASRKTHPLVETTRRLLEKGNTDTQGMLRNYSAPHLDVTTSPASLNRALQFWTSLIQACESEGWKVVLAEDPQNERFSRTVGVVNDERLVLRLRETYRQERFVPTREELQKAKRSGSSYWPSLRYRPTGIFEFTAKGEDAGWDLVRVRDGRAKIDEGLVWLLSAFREAAEKNRSVREQRAREQEEARRREERRLREEERRAAEQRRRTELVQEAEQWHRSARLRQYLARVRRSAEPGTRLAEWIDWAESVASDLDPLPRRTRTKA